MSKLNMIETIETKEEAEIYFSASSFLLFIVHNLPRKESQMFVHIVWLLDNTDY